MKSKSVEGVALATSLLQSLGATTADHEAVLNNAVITSVLNSWVPESWLAVAEAIVPHRRLSEKFHAMAEKRYATRFRKHAGFSGYVRARVPVARAAFLAARRDSDKPFIQLVDIPAGAFTMGSPLGETGRGDDEQQVMVRITKPFRIGRTVVTQSQWSAVMGSEPWLWKEKSCIRWSDPAGLEKDKQGERFPAIQISWGDAKLFCETLTVLEREAGRLAAAEEYRLPTEAEWEYACRAGTTTAYSFGDAAEELHGYGWHNDAERACNSFSEVAKKKPNPWGLYDVHGNVLEWCADAYEEKLPGGNDPIVRSTSQARVARGGCWVDDAASCRSARRSYQNVTQEWNRSVNGMYFGGLRVVLANT